ncbi:MAG: UPF0280 family protein [Desulfatitalea sp.]
MSDGSETNTPFQERAYRQLVRSHLTAARVVVQQTDLGIYSDRPVAEAAKEAVIEQRSYLEGYIRRNPEFVRTLRPFPEDPLAPPIVRKMIAAGRAADVGPMAAVAGAVAEQVGHQLLKQSSEVVVENGGDIFIHTHQPMTVGLYAGPSPLSLKIGLRIAADAGVHAVCTSSGTVGHSLSFGRADAVCVLSGGCALADAAATAVGNRVRAANDIPAAIRWGRDIAGVLGLLIVVGDKMGAWGAIEVVRL